MDRAFRDDVSELVTCQITLEGMAACLVILWIRLRRGERERQKGETGGEGSLREERESTTIVTPGTTTVTMVGSFFNQ